MAVKSDAKQWSIQEQIVEDPATGLTFQFEVVEGAKSRYRMRVFGNLPFGNREIVFTDDGICDGGGTFTTALCKPGWLSPIDD